MIKLLKADSFKNKYKKYKIKGQKKQLKTNTKKDQYIFCNIDKDEIDVLSWRLYQDNDGEDVYSLYESCKENKNNHCHYGLQINKLTNIFNNKEISTEKK